MGRVLYCIGNQYGTDTFTDCKQDSRISLQYNMKISERKCPNAKRRIAEVVEIENGWIFFVDTYVSSNIVGGLDRIPFKC